MRLFGLIGYPLTQSFSKKYFDEKIEKQGLTDCRFENFQLSSIDELPILLHRNPELHGLAVTIPYKKAVLPFLHSTSFIPAGLQACNCIRIDKGMLEGHNTDHTGFEKSLLPLLKAQHTKALVLGNGGATEAVKFVLRKLGIAFEVVSRRLHNGSTLTYDAIDQEVVAAHSIIINTTPLGMYPDLQGYPLIPYESITADHLLYDLVYNPERTVFLQLGAAKGATIKNGYEMLVLQAEENWRIWTS